MLELEKVSSTSVFSVLCRLQPKVLCVFNQGNAVFEVLIRKIKGQSSIIMCSALLSEAKSDRACFHSQLVKQRPKNSPSFSFTSFTVKTGFSKQEIQSSVRGVQGYTSYNQQLIENEENVTLPFEMISIIFMQICNATPKMLSRRPSKSAQRLANGHVEVSPVPCRILL